MNDNDKKISPLWMIPATLALWGLIGFVFYTMGTLARAALL